MELGTNMLKVCGLIKEQCSYALVSILKQEDEYEMRNAKQDVL